MFMLGLTLAILSALCRSVTSVSSRILKRVNFAVIMFNYGFLQANIFGFILLGIYAWTNRLPCIYDSWTIYGELLIANILNLVGLGGILIACQNANPSLVGMIMFLGVGYNFLADFVIFNTQISGMQLVGVSISLFFTLIVAAYKMQQDTEKVADNDDNYQRIETTIKDDVDKAFVQWTFTRTHSSDSFEV